ncbi:CcdB family protein [Luteimonas huabeiensis]|uniref:CcdB family protein n=1 Tax=Luteimonas huabeiensis TaxID=1244513 RepID=UPI000463FA75|nr:CcdB family protein [Luteimonas huabeiensis]
MAQFDVHRNPGRLKIAIPYVVVVQSAIFDASRHRVVAPLVSRQEAVALNPRFNPVFVVEGREVVLHPLEMTAIPAERLGEPVASLAAHGDDIIAAVDELLTPAYG